MGVLCAVCVVPVLGAGCRARGVGRGSVAVGGGAVLRGIQPLSKPRFWNPCGLCVVSVKVGDR